MNRRFRRCPFRFRRVTGIILLAFITGVTAGCAQTPPEPADASSPAAVTVTAAAQSPTVLSSAPSEALAGVEPEKFTAAVKEYIDALNAEESAFSDMTVRVSVTYIIGFVDITLSDVTVWSGFADSEKKDYITKLGKALDELAIANTYPGTLPQVGTDTTLYGPDGAELAERTSLGIVILS